MFLRLLDFLRCPECGRTLVAEDLDSPDGSDEIEHGLLHCAADHWFPVTAGIPRLLPDALREHWQELEPRVEVSTSYAVRAARAALTLDGKRDRYDHRTRANFNAEWEHHQLGDNTWGMSLDDRVRWFFLEPLGIPEDEFDGKVVLDAGCGNGSQSVAYTALGAEVIAVDLSSGLKRGHAFRDRYAGAHPEKVHFVQADLQRPPLARPSVDVIHSAGVLHHTPDTERSFRALCPILKPGGTFYVWVYKREPVVTRIVNSLRAVTTRLPAPVFAKVAAALAPAFVAFCWALNKLGVRRYPAMTRREAALSLLDIFGAPHAHAHSYSEVEGWYRSEGFDEIWPCNDDRRGFGVCGRRATSADGIEPTR